MPGGSFRRDDSGFSAPGEASFVLDMATSAVQTIPGFCRYFKSDAAFLLPCRLKLDTSNITLPVIAGTNIERLQSVTLTSITSSATLIFLG